MDGRTTAGAKTICLAPNPGETTDSTWLYYGNTEFHGDFATDIDALAHGENCPSSTSNDNTPPPSHNANVEASGRQSTGRNTYAESIYVDTLASLNPNQGSICDLEMEDSLPSRERHMRSPLFEHEANGPSPLETWMNTHERHDLFSYRGVQPATKKLKVARGPGDAGANKKGRR